MKVGGKDAIVISAKGTSIYCSTPESCFEGTVEVKVGEQTVILPEKYQYEPQMVVTDLCGDVDELGNGDVVETGPFDNCGKIEYPFGSLSIPNILTFFICLKIIKVDL